MRRSESLPLLSGDSFDEVAPEVDRKHFSVLVVGKAGVGKSLLMQRIVSSYYPEEFPAPKEIKEATVQTEYNKTPVTLILEDFSAKDEVDLFQYQGVLLTYDASSIETFLWALDFLKKLNSMKNESIVVVICANKIDLAKLPTLFDCKTLASKFSFQVSAFETNALINKNVENVCEKLMDGVYLESFNLKNFFHPRAWVGINSFLNHEIKEQKIEESIASSAAWLDEFKERHEAAIAKYRDGDPEDTEEAEKSSQGAAVFRSTPSPSSSMPPAIPCYEANIVNLYLVGGAQEAKTSFLRLLSQQDVVEPPDPIETVEFLSVPDECYPRNFPAQKKGNNIIVWRYPFDQQPKFKYNHLNAVFILYDVNDPLSGFYPSNMSDIQPMPAAEQCLHDLNTQYDSSLRMKLPIIILAGESKDGNCSALISEFDFHRLQSQYPNLQIMAHYTVSFITQKFQKSNFLHAYEDYGSSPCSLSALEFFRQTVEGIIAKNGRSVGPRLSTSRHLSVFQSPLGRAAASSLARDGISGQESDELCSNAPGSVIPLRASYLVLKDNGTCHKDIGIPKKLHGELKILLPLQNNGCELQNEFSTVLSQVAAVVHFYIKPSKKEGISALSARFRSFNWGSTQIPAATELHKILISPPQSSSSSESKSSTSKPASQAPSNFKELLDLLNTQLSAPGIKSQGRYAQHLKYAIAAVKSRWAQIDPDQAQAYEYQAQSGSSAPSSPPSH